MYLMYLHTFAGIIVRLESLDDTKCAGFLSHVVPLHQLGVIYTLWLLNIAMENHHF
jgi:hypothetical protein